MECSSPLRAHCRSALSIAVPATQIWCRILHRRSCQLAPGWHALMQRLRMLDALDPVLRARLRAKMERMQTEPPREQMAVDRAALEATVEM